MKKLTSILCALMLVLSVSAAPRKVAFDAEKASAEKEMVAKKAALTPAFTAPQKVAPMVKRLPAKVNEVVNIDLTDAETVDFADYTTDPEEAWFQMRSQGTDYMFSLCINTDHLAGTFAPEEFDMGYTYLYVADSTVSAGYSKINLIDTTISATVTIDTLGAITFNTVVTAEDGNEYHITQFYYEAPFVPTGDTIDVVITDPMTYTYYKTQGDWWMRGENAQYGVKIDIVNNDSTSPAGTYTEDDALASFTYITEKATSTSLALVEMDAVVTDNAGNIDLVAYMLCDDGNVYHITMGYVIPEAQYFDTIVATNLDIEEVVSWFSSYYVATASNAGYKVSLTLSSDTPGAYKAQGTVTPLNGVASTIYSGTVTLATTADGYAITGDVLCFNNTEYNLDLTFVMPTKTREVTFTCADALLTDYSATDGVWQLRGYNADSSKFVSVCVYSEQIAGTYTRGDMYKAYTKAYEIINDTTDVEFKMLDANITAVVATNGDITVTGTLLLQNTEDVTDVPEYTISLTYVKPQASREVTVTIDAELNDLTADHGVWQIRGFNAAGDLYVSVAAYANQLAGTYTTSMLYTDYTVAVTIVGADTTYFDAVDADFTVTVDADNNVVLAGDILFQNETDRTDLPLFHLTMNSAISTGIEYDEEEDNFNRNYASYEVEDQYLAQNGIVFVIADDGSSQMILEFLTPAEGIVDGTYAINQSEEEMTVWAGDGWDDQGYPNYSFVLTYEGKSIQQIWFMVEGTVTVQAGKITVNAVNSYGRTIKAVLNNGTGVETVKATENNGTEKFMRNGQLIIRANGVEYNAQGAVL